MADTHFVSRSTCSVPNSRAAYSQVAEVRAGHVIYIAGGGPTDKGGRVVGKSDVLAQAEQIFQNIRSAVEASGATLRNIIKLNYYVVDRVDNGLIADLLKRCECFVDKASPPTITLVFISRLIDPEWLIEIEAIAVVNTAVAENLQVRTASRRDASFRGLQ